MTSKKLTAKQKLFIKEYLVDLNATQAAKRAGYAGDDNTLGQVGFENLRKPEIAAAVQDEMNKRAKRTEITADYVLNTIRETVDRCRQAEPVEVWDPIAKEMVRTGEWKFEHSGVLKGCELLGRHLKLFTDKTEHSTADGKPIVVLTMPANGSEASEDSDAS